MHQHFSNLQSCTIQASLVILMRFEAFTPEETLEMGYRKTAIARMFYANSSKIQQELCLNHEIFSSMAQASACKSRLQPHSRNRRYCPTTSKRINSYRFCPMPVHIATVSFLRHIGSLRAYVYRSTESPYQPYLSLLNPTAPAKHRLFDVCRLPLHISVTNPQVSSQKPYRSSLRAIRSAPSTPAFPTTISVFPSQNLRAGAK